MVNGTLAVATSGPGRESRHTSDRWGANGQDPCVPSLSTREERSTPVQASRRLQLVLRPTHRSLRHERVLSVSPGSSYPSTFHPPTALRPHARATASEHTHHMIPTRLKKCKSVHPATQFIRAAAAAVPAALPAAACSARPRPCTPPSSRPFASPCASRAQIRASHWAAGAPEASLARRRPPVRQEGRSRCACGGV